MSNNDDFDLDYYLSIGDEEVEDEEWDDEDDESYRPKKSNGRKALLPLFVFEILKQDSNHHFKQREILERLSHQPFEIQVERKALSRTLHSLEDSGLGVCSSKGDGTWFDPNKSWGTMVS